RAAQAELLHLLCAEAGDSSFRYPDGKGSHGPDLVDFRRPFVDGPVIPIKRETMDRHHVDGFQGALTLELPQEIRIDGRNAAQRTQHAGILGANRLRGAAKHRAENGPVRVHLEIPMRQIIWLVPKHHRFDHSGLRRQMKISASGWESISKPELR